MGDLKYKVGDKVRIKNLDWYNENKASDDEIRCYPCWFGKEQSKWCGKVMTISDVRADHYTMIEDLVEYWTDEMIEGLVEEECPQDFIEKYCISCGTQRCDRTKEFIDGCPYYNEYMSIKQNNTVEEESKNTDDINRESYVKAESNKYFQEYMNSLCKEHDEMIEGFMKDGTIVDYVKESNDRYRIIIDPRFDIEVDEGEYYAVRRKKEYPKTYEECCRVLGISDGEFMFSGLSDDEYDLFDSFVVIKRCRDAYWKIAGEEMGLGKPWEPEDLRYVYSFFRWDGDINMSNIHYGNNNIFEFPTEEMRDAFYENFKKEIEICKELL